MFSYYFLVKEKAAILLKLKPETQEIWVYFNLLHDFGGKVQEEDFTYSSQERRT